MAVAEMAGSVASHTGELTRNKFCFHGLRRLWDMGSHHLQTTGFLGRVETPGNKTHITGNKGVNRKCEITREKWQKPCAASGAACGVGATAAALLLVLSHLCSLHHIQG